MPARRPPRQQLLVDRGADVRRPVVLSPLRPPGPRRSATAQSHGPDTSRPGCRPPQERPSRADIALPAQAAAPHARSQLNRGQSRPTGEDAETVTLQEADVVASRRRWAAGAGGQGLHRRRRRHPRSAQAPPRRAAAHRQLLLKLPDHRAARARTLTSTANAVITAMTAVADAQASLDQVFST
jgi:hypothetical protein